MDVPPIRVLLIEDNCDDARQVRDALAAAPLVRFDVVHVARLADGLQHLQRQASDVVLLDLSLPDSQGLATFVRTFTQAPNLPIVVLSGSADEEMALLAAQVGAQDYLVKERLNPATLARAIRYAIERKRSEIALRNSEERYRALFEHNHTGVVFASPSFQILDCNNAFAQILGFPTSADALAQTRGTDFLRSQQREEYWSRLQKERSLNNLECQWSKSDGSTVWVLGNLSLLDSEDGASVIQGIFIDISEHKHLEEKFRQSQKMEAIGRLAGGVAHDFNNLLTVIRGFSELMIHAMRPGDPMRSHAEEVKNAADRAAALTRHLLAFSRKQILQFRTVDLNAILGETEKMLRRLIGEDVEMVCQQGVDLGCVKADPGQIEQVLLNLAVNARDAMPDGGKLTLSTANLEVAEDSSWTEQGAAAGRYVLLSVSDTGCGMTKAVLTHLFEPFFTTKEKGKGTGLGLSTVYGIVKQSEGFIDVQSELNRGTTFRVLLPRLGEDAAVEKKAPLPTLARSGRETILLAEDEPLVCRVSSMILRQHGYRVLIAASGEEALRFCREHPQPIHLLVSDVVMPHMGGTELAQKAIAMRPELKVLFLSGYTADAVMNQGIAEMTAFLQKPFTSDSLARKVREILDLPRPALPLATTGAALNSFA